MKKEIDGLVKYYTELAFPNTAQVGNCREEPRLKLPSRSPYRFERVPPPRTPPPSIISKIITEYLPDKSQEYMDKLPFRVEKPLPAPIRASGTPQYVQQPAPVAAQNHYPLSQPDPAATATAAETTTAAATATTTNGYNALGWKTDDDGNVFLGDDNAKLLLIQMPPKKYWDPLPKDWPEADLFGPMFPDSKNYRGPNPSCPKC
ncbi:hypothetical protein PENTCL1PPCAC_5345, partial [Pristionchus entomophagus]